MLILINGPLGVGKSTLAEVLTSRIPACVMIDGDALVEANPEPRPAVLAGAIAVLVKHYREHGFRHFVVNHLWTSADEIRDLCRRVVGEDREDGCYAVRLTLPEREVERRIRKRAGASISTDVDQELRTSALESRELDGAAGDELGEPLDASPDPDALAGWILARLSDLRSGGRSRPTG